MLTLLLGCQYVNQNVQEWWMMALGWSQLDGSNCGWPAHISSGSRLTWPDPFSASAHLHPSKMPMVGVSISYMQMLSYRGPGCCLVDSTYFRHSGCLEWCSEDTWTQDMHGDTNTSLVPNLDPCLCGPWWQLPRQGLPEEIVKIWVKKAAREGCL